MDRKPKTEGLEDLVPRLKGQGYDREGIRRRLSWTAEKVSARIEHLQSFSGDSEKWAGNIENPIGAAQIPIGVAGPLRVNGEAARGVFYVPMATTEGALVRSYERGMVALTRAGGVEVVVASDGNQISPSFFLQSPSEAKRFKDWLPLQLSHLVDIVATTTGHGRLTRIECRVYGRQVIADLSFHTADAQGMNMIVKATDAICRWISEQFPIDYHLFSGMCSEKRASGFLLSRGKGRWVTAGAFLSDSLVRIRLGCSAKALHQVWQSTMIGHVAANAVGYCGQYANALAAIFIATGQDVANVANAAVGITNFELDREGIYVSVTLPGLEVATVGGGTALETQRECLQLLGCFGEGKSSKLAEIIAAAVLGGEISMAGAIASGEFASAHERYGRNRPEEKE